jgi:hypothetical protein
VVEIKRFSEAVKGSSHQQRKMINYVGTKKPKKPQKKKKPF